MSAVLLGAAFGIAVLAGARGTWSPCGLSMVSAINPMSERSRGYRYWLTAIWFVLGSLVGSLLIAGPGAAVAFVLSWAGVSPSVLLGAGVVAALVALASDRKLAGFQLPSHPRQVNELWLMQYRRWLYASGFGAQIGSGFATYIMTAANYLVVALAGLTASPRSAFAIGLCFGLVRGLAVLLSSRCRTAQQLVSLHRRLARWQPWSLRVVLAAEAAVAVGLACAISGLIFSGVALVVTVAITFGTKLVGLAAARTPDRKEVQLNKHELVG